MRQALLSATKRKAAYEPSPPDDPGDYASPGEKTIRERILERIGDGGIILIHDGIEETINLLPGLIGDLKARGYTFVTIDDWLDHHKGRKSQALALAPQGPVQAFR